MTAGVCMPTLRGPGFVASDEVFNFLVSSILIYENANSDSTFLIGL